MSSARGVLNTSAAVGVECSSRVVALFSSLCWGGSATLGSDEVLRSLNEVPSSISTTMLSVLAGGGERGVAAVKWGERGEYTVCKAP